MTKILIIATEYPPEGSGIANVVKALGDGFNKNGHEVTIEYPSEKMWKKILTHGGVGLLKFWKKQAFDINNGKHRDKDIIMLHNPLLPEEIYVQPEKIICTVHTTYKGRWAHMPYALWPKDIFKNVYHRWMVHKEKSCYKNMADLKFTALTTQVRDEIETLGIEAIEVDIIPNGVDTDVFCLGEKKVKDSFCVATRLCEWKGVEKVVRNFKINNISMLGSLKVAGDGPLKKKLEKIAGVDKRIQFLGKISKEEIIKLFQESAYYISQSEYEGMPLTLLEAMSCGCFPIVSDIPGHKEVADQTTLFATPESIHKFIKENYSWSKVVDKYEVLFDET